MTAQEIVGARVSLGLSRKEFAAAILCAPHTVCHWEGGRQPISAWFAGEIRALLRRHERSAAAAPVAGSPFLPIPDWRIAELRGKLEQPPAPATFVPDPWRDDLATELKYRPMW